MNQSGGAVYQKRFVNEGSCRTIWPRGTSFVIETSLPAPVSLNPDVAPRAAVPVTGNPHCPGLRGQHPATAHPDIPVTVPAMVPIDPHIPGTRRNWMPLDDGRWGRYVNHHLGEGRTRSQQRCRRQCQHQLLHISFSLSFLLHGFSSSCSSVPGFVNARTSAYSYAFIDTDARSRLRHKSSDRRDRDWRFPSSLSKIYTASKVWMPRAEWWMEAVPTAFAGGREIHRRLFSELNPACRKSRLLA